MDNKKLNSNAFWTKAEREFHIRKNPSKISTANNIKSAKSEDRLSNLQSPIMTTITFPAFDSNNVIKTSASISTTNLSTDSKIGIKDLCNEDKMRIGNLVKELAKKEAEKEDIKKCLENERQLYENKLKEMLDQQDKLIKEKELLLQNFADKQEKLEKLLVKREKRNHKSSSDKYQKTNLDAQRQSNHVNALFSRQKSSTPNNLSPRSISPIPVNELNNKIFKEKSIKSATTKNDQVPKLQLKVPEKEERNFTKEIDNEIIKLKAKPLLNSTIINENSSDNNQDVRVEKPKKVVNDDNEAEIRKQQLMQQRVELKNEQEMLKNLIEQQERLLREKNEQIMIQQKLHRDRLEQLITKKTQINDEALMAQKQVAAIPALYDNLASFNHKQQMTPLGLNFAELNLNNEIRQNIHQTPPYHREQTFKPTTYQNHNHSNSLNNSKNSIKMKQENSFDIFDLLVDNNQQSTVKQKKSPQYEHDAYNQREFRHQNNYQTNSVITTTTIDEDENKLFEEIFFVN